MRHLFALAAIATFLSGCQTAPGAGGAMNFYSGEGESRYEDERLSAEAISSILSISCSGDQIRYRYNEVELLQGDCTRFPAPPVLVRQRVLSNEESILMVMNSSVGVVGEGTLILYDESRMLPIAVDNLESFGDVLARDRIVIHGGTIDQSACGMTLWSKELTLDWEHGRIARERNLPRAQPTC